MILVSPLFEIMSETCGNILRIVCGDVANIKQDVHHQIFVRFKNRKKNLTHRINEGIVGDEQSLDQGLNTINEGIIGDNTKD